VFVVVAPFRILFQARLRRQCADALTGARSCRPVGCGQPRGNPPPRPLVSLQCEKTSFVQSNCNGIQTRQSISQVGARCSRRPPRQLCLRPAGLLCEAHGRWPCSVRAGVDTRARSQRDHRG
jgi:hypothetical protein